MRDYNTIPFRSPRSKGGTSAASSSTGPTVPANTTVTTSQQKMKVKEHPLSISAAMISPDDHHHDEEKKQDGGSNASGPSTATSFASSISAPSSPFRHQQQQQQIRHPLERQPSPSHVNNNSNNNVNKSNNGSSNNTNNNRNSISNRTAVFGGGVTTTKPTTAPPQTAAASPTNASNNSTAGKTDAVILELRSSARQLKRQLEKVQEEKRGLEQEYDHALRQLEQERRSHQNFQHNDDASKDGRVGELQVQLDRAHAQILTADMVRKELEDTLEAEQYTWELRVQDQERTIQQLQQECVTLSDDLRDTRREFGQERETWTKQADELQAKLEKAQQEAAHWKKMQSDSQDIGYLKSRIVQLEQERTELQSCLDEALKELEAVDQELQGDALREENERLQQLLLAHQRESGGDGKNNKDHSETLEGLRHLYRWLLERDGVEESVHSSPLRDTKQAIKAIEEYLERRTPPSDKDLIDTRKQVSALENQLSVYRGDLKAREESSSELRASLKEAVALLKPLQDAVAKADKEKSELKREIETLRRSSGGGGVSGSPEETKRLKAQLDQKEQEVQRLQHEIEKLELELSKAKMTAASSLIDAHRSAVGDIKTPDSLTKAREELKAKRATERTLKQLLQDAQTRFSTLHTQNKEVAAMNSELQGRLNSAVEKLDTKPSGESDGIDSIQHQLAVRESKLHDLENELKVLRGELAEKDVELRESELKLREARAMATPGGGHHQHYRQLEAKLASNLEELSKMKGSEKSLKKSLKEALGLIKPLQMHLEEAENEKRELAMEIRELRRASGSSKDQRNGVSPKSPANETVAIRELEETVKHLENENSQLHDALEDMSQSVNASHLSGVSNRSQKNDSRLREEIVELQSRNEVTNARLQDAFSENHALVESLTKREKEENAFREEIRALKEKLRKSQGELDNAKFIATSALVKVEELTMANVEQLSLTSSVFDRDEVFKAKSRELDHKMKAVQEQSAKGHRNR